jgi:hypothetical protein
MKHATIVIWGWYGAPGDIVPISVNFEILRSPRHMPTLGQAVSGQIQQMTLADLTSFRLQIRLASEMSYLSAFVVGMTRYETQNWHEAADIFTNALKFLEDDSQALSKAVVYFKRGVSLNKFSRSQIGEVGN